MTNFRRAWDEAPPQIRILALALAVCTIALSVLGFVHALVIKMPAFEIGGELDEGIRFSPAFSTLQLLAISALALFAAKREPLPDVSRGVWVLLAALFVFLATDEVFEIHERAEDAVGVTWQVLYLPILIAAVGAWLIVLRSMRQGTPERFLWILAAVIAVLARLIDNIPFTAATPDEPDLADFAAGIEEVLEFIGNSSFLLAIALTLAYLASGEPRGRKGSA